MLWCALVPGALRPALSPPASVCACTMLTGLPLLTPPQHSHPHPAAPSPTFAAEPLPVRRLLCPAGRVHRGARAAAEPCGAPQRGCHTVAAPQGEMGPRLSGCGCAAVAPAHMPRGLAAVGGHTADPRGCCLESRDLSAKGFAPPTPLPAVLLFGCAAPSSAAARLCCCPRPLGPSRSSRVQCRSRVRLARSATS